MKFAEAFEELQQLVKGMEQGEISIDDLADKVKRANELVEICKTKLRNAEKEINDVLQKTDQPT
jgi:exodeoxyribonuclease VII small subunit